VAARWPSVVVRDDHGRPGLDRGAIRAIVLDDPAELAALNAIVHPRVWEAAEAWMEAREDEGAPAVVVEAALMVETGSWRRYDRLLVVTCADAVQRARLAARNGFDAETVEKAIAAQLPNAAKEACADELIRNDGDQAALAVATAAAWERILATPSTIPKVPGA
jgi:dephospho-CoA kinase